ncbi:hypothetical protein IWW37_004954 [Coemansia sp. RSA 2050]|nr:hypothetical protein IWW37_004954 [Coemansia sp. RSA 2050]KAJ2730894.1 hypothetical protein IW152_004924 [Coemansia sp. BCRC 34962]
MSQQHRLRATPSLGGSSSPLGAGFNVVNTMIGSGILALPYALKEAGFYFGIFVLVLVAFLTAFSLNTLVFSGRRVGLYKYEAVSAAALGRSGYYLLSFALSVNSIGSCISYLIIVGDIVTSLVQTMFGLNFFTTRQAVIVVAALGFTLPLLFFRTLEPLVRPSALSVLCLPVIVLIVAIRGPTYALPEPAPTPVFGPSILPAFGVIAFAYSCSQTCFQNYQTLQNRTLTAWSKATFYATATAAVIYLAFSIVSYRSFGLGTQPNLLNNFDNDDVLANVARVLLAFTLTLTYPMQFYPVRDLLAECVGLPVETLTRSQKPLFHGLTLLLFAGTLATALVVADLGFVFKLIGTAASSLLVFGLPGVIYLRLVSPYLWSKHVATVNESMALLLIDVGHSDSDGDDDSILEPCTSVISGILLLLGFGVFVIGTWTSIREFLSL